MIGRTIGNYVVRDKIGEGGMGAVYVAAHPRLGRQVAIKVLLHQFSQNQQLLTRFFNEARAAHEIRHEHIIEVLDFGTLPEGDSYIVMEWLDGKMLSHAVTYGEPVPTPRALHILRGIGEALTAAHAHGIVHRDLKPDNIFLIRRGDDANFVKVLDFGIAKLMGEDRPGNVKTQTGAVMGTPSYMSPEQCKGVQVDHRADIYSLGIIAYQLFTGVVPFNSDAPGEIMLFQMTQEPQAPSKVAPGIPQHIERAILRALDKDPAKRFQSISAFIDALSGGMADTMAPAMMHTLNEASGEVSKPTTRPAKTMPKASAIIGAVVVMILGAAVALTVRKMGTHVVKPVAATADTIMAAPTATAVAPKKIDDSASKAAKATITIDTQPLDAVVYVDGAETQHTFSALLTNTPHEIRVTAVGYDPKIEKMIFDANKVQTMDLSKTKVPAVAKSHDKPTYNGTKNKIDSTNPY